MLVTESVEDEDRVVERVTVVVFDADRVIVRDTGRVADDVCVAERDDGFEVVAVADRDRVEERVLMDSRTKHAITTST